MTALFQAARTGDAAKVAGLLRAMGPNPEASSEALLAAGFRDNQEIARLLLDAGADPDVEWDGQTLLGVATCDGKVGLVRLLLERGAAVNAVDPEGMTPLAWAAKVDHGHAEIIDALLGAGADPELAEKNGRRPVDWAEMFENTLALEALRNISAGQ
jgi:ankyrin repeat protein